MGVGREMKVRFPVWLILQTSVESSRGEFLFHSLIARADKASLPIAQMATTALGGSGLVLETPWLLICRAYSSGVSCGTHMKHL